MLPRRHAMHGMVFVALEQHLRDLREEALRAACFPPGAYLAIGDYPEEDLLRIAEAFASRPGVLQAQALSEVLRSFGEAIPPLVERFSPTLLPKASSFQELLGLIDRETSSDARSILPRFSVEPREDGLISLKHRGDSRLCRFSEGLLVGFASSLGEAIAFRHPNCRGRGDAACLFVARLLRAETTLRMRGPRPPPKR